MSDIKNNDQIYEAYMGTLGKNMQNKTKERFLWMSENIKGDEIFDIGCSSGIFPILLGREGKKVLGLDIDEDAINKAKELQKQEGNLVKENVSFVSGSINDYNTNKKFDTIILSEILEHLFYPSEVLKKVSKMLKKDGVVIVTVPFGVNSYFDHKKTYYIADLLMEISAFLNVTEIQYFGNWIGLKCVDKAVDSKIIIDEKFLKKFESEIEKKESELEEKYLNALEIIKEKSGKVVELADEKKDLNLKIDKANDLNQLLKKQAEDNAVLNHMVELNTNYQRKNLRYEKKVNSIQNELNERMNELKIYKGKCNKYKLELAKLKQENIELKIKVKRFNNRKVIRLVKKYIKVRHVILHPFKSLSKPKVQLTPNMAFYNNIDKYIKNIKVSNGSNYYDSKLNIKLGIITDEFMYQYYKDAVNVLYIDYTNYKEQLKKVDVLLYITTWRGMKNDDWRGNNIEERCNMAIETIRYAKSLGKKVIFQSKEDPSNYDVFLPIAKEADYIFTTAEEIIPKYKMDTNNNNVFLLDFAVNPQLCNPIGFKNNSFDKVFFAGSWVPRYEERCNDTKEIFNGVVSSDKTLLVADRNAFRKGFEYPDEYKQFIVPSIEHDKLQRVHKLFDWSLNFNSIKYSPTMCALRVYELQALGNLIISNYSISVNNKFPNIFIAQQSYEVSKILNSYNDIDIYRMQVDGIRNAMTNNTIYDRLNNIFDKIGQKNLYFKDKNVLVVCDTIDDKINEMFNKQTYLNKELKDIKSITPKDLDNYNYIAYFSKNYYYKQNYLTDMINAFKYTDSSFITILSKIKDNRILGVNHDYVSKTNKIDLTVFDAKKHYLVDVLSKKKISGSGYSIDPFQITDLKYTVAEKPELSVIVPIYNNGEFLKNKCFNSLRRSSIFKKMEIILVDDGSDGKNVEIVKQIQSEYDNVKTFFFGDGGSGTASRPRNKGVELATTPYVTFLDPDNEAVNDGYAKLLDIIRDSDYDFVFGSIIKLNDKVRPKLYFSESRELTNSKMDLVERNFEPNSIQAAIIKKDFIIKNNIKSPIGGAGQDSLFFTELMANANHVYYLNMPIHIYYAARSGSVVNSINHTFYEKFLVMEKYQVEILKKHDLLQEYLKRRYNHFLNIWYIKKLQLVNSESEYNKSVKIINEIQKLYGDKNLYNEKFTGSERDIV